MYKLISAILIIIILSVVFGTCQKDIKIIVRTPCYYILETIADHHAIYSFFIIARSGKILDQGLVDSQCPVIKSLNNQIIMVSIPSGNVLYTTFYDVIQEKKSQIYQNVQYADNDIFVYTTLEDHRWYLIISALLNNSVIKKTPVDLAGVTGMLEKVTVDKDQKEVCITYISMDNYTEKQIMIDWQ